VSEYRLDLELMPNDKGFRKKKSGFIKELGPSVNAVDLCEKYFQDLSVFVKEAEQKYGNFKHFKRNKAKSNFRVNSDLTLSQHKRQF